MSHIKIIRNFIVRVFMCGEICTGYRYSTKCVLYTYKKIHPEHCKVKCNHWMFWSLMRRGWLQKYDTVVWNSLHSSTTQKNANPKPPRNKPQDNSSKKPTPSTNNKRNDTNDFGKVSSYCHPCEFWVKNEESVKIEWYLTIDSLLSNTKLHYSQPTSFRKIRLKKFILYRFRYTENIPSSCIRNGTSKSYDGLISDRLIHHNRTSICNKIKQCSLYIVITGIYRGQQEHMTKRRATQLLVLTTSDHRNMSPLTISSRLLGYLHTWLSESILHLIRGDDRSSIRCHIMDVWELVTLRCCADTHKWVKSKVFFQTICFVWKAEKSACIVDKNYG